MNFPLYLLGYYWFCEYCLFLLVLFVNRTVWLSLGFVFSQPESLLVNCVYATSFNTICLSMFEHNYVIMVQSFVTIAPQQQQ